VLKNNRTANAVFTGKEKKSQIWNSGYSWFL